MRDFFCVNIIIKLVVIDLDDLGSFEENQYTVNHFGKNYYYSLFFFSLNAMIQLIILLSIMSWKSFIYKVFYFIVIIFTIKTKSR